VAVPTRIEAISHSPHCTYPSARAERIAQPFGGQCLIGRLAAADRHRAEPIIQYAMIGITGSRLPESLWITTKFPGERHISKTVTPPKS
jgi:hypothetical protein